MLVFTFLSRNIIILLAMLVFLPLIAYAQQPELSSDTAPPQPAVIISVSPFSSEQGDGTRYSARLLKGSEKGKTITIEDSPSTITVGYAKYHVGDTVLVATYTRGDSTKQYLITDYERRGRIGAVVLLFLVAVIWLSRWQGVRSIIGLLLTYLVIIYWIVPRIVDGHDPVTASISGSTLTLIVTLLLTEGWRRKMWAAASGMVVTMLVIGFLSAWAVGFTRLTGGGNEEAFILQSQGYGQIDVRGLLLAGFIIGTLGLLDDIAVSQVAIVAELRRANRSMTRRQAYQAALRVGRSHMAAIVNTLVLAYAGSALPLLVLFGASHASFSDIVNGETVATEIIRSVVGSLGLVLAMPITTLIAIWFNVRSDHPMEEHSHTHSH